MLILIIFCVLILVIALIGLAGNLRFFIVNRKVNNLHKQLLVLLTAIHIPQCLFLIADSIRVFIGIPLTRFSCLRFIGSLCSLVSLSQSVLHAFLGLELLILISGPLLYRRLKLCWFHIAVYSSFILSAYLVTISWISEEDHYVLLCSPQTALDAEALLIGNTFITVINILVLVEYASILAILCTKKSILRGEIKRKTIVSSLILAVVFLLSWFTNIAIIRYSDSLSQLLGIPDSTVLTFAILPAALTFSQTHYVYFFVGSKNRLAFREIGPVALFTIRPVPNPKVHPAAETPIHHESIVPNIQ